MIIPLQIKVSVPYILTLLKCCILQGYCVPLLGNNCPMLLMNNQKSIFSNFFESKCLSAFINLAQRKVRYSLSLINSDPYTVPFSSQISSSQSSFILFSVWLSLYSHFKFLSALLLSLKSMQHSFASSQARPKDIFTFIII